MWNRAIMNITPTDKRIRTLFQSNFYKIPRFQRPYSWDKGNIEDFWTDAVGGGKDGYFIGSMVMFGDKGDQELFVVDGQQRLTTITIFLAALRDTLLDAGEKDLAEGIQNVIQRNDIANKSRFVLLTETSYPYFQEYVQKLGAPDVTIEPSEEEKGIQSAYNFARERYKAMRDEAAGELEGAKRKIAVRKKLEAARDRLLGLEVIIVQLDNEDDAYVVFETLNTRGKDLEPKDLIKNLLAKLIKPKNADVDPAKIKWKEMIDQIAASAASIDASTYLHHFWLSRYDYTPERTLFDKVKKRVTKSNAVEMLDAMVQDVEQYRRIFEPDNFAWDAEADSLRRSLRALAIFKVRQPTPMILSVLRAYRDKRISLKQARDTMAAIERFHFMHTAVAGLSSSGGVSFMYAAAARDLTNEGDTQKRAKLLQDFIAKLKARRPEEDAFVTGFIELRYSNAETRNRGLVRYILERLDMQVRKDAAIDYSKMTIEHIGPQNPDGAAPLARYAEIGNLVLVSDDLNGKLKNKGFAEKKAIMNEAKLPLDEIVATAADWNDAVIDQRTEAIAKVVYAA
jgi:hypothetical protein